MEQQTLTDGMKVAIIGGVFAAFSVMVQVFGAVLIARMNIKVTRIEEHTNSMHDAIVKITGEAERAKGRLEVEQEQKVADAKKNGDPIA
jgi:hypothetical protein